MERRWTIDLHPEARDEVAALPKPVRFALGEALGAVQVEGPNLGRPLVDTLQGSRHANMKELRFETKEAVWRFAFAFDPMQRAIVLIGGDKQGVSKRKFYKWLISHADARFDSHLEGIKS